MTETLVTLDLRGLSCPVPIVKTALAMKKIPPGALLEATATDPGSVADFGAWCEKTGNPLVASSEENGEYRFLIRKG